MQIQPLSLDSLRQKMVQDHLYERIYGSYPEVIEEKKKLVDSVLQTYLSTFGKPKGSLAVVHVPGRLEFLGKHTDYAGGPVLNMAASRGFIAISGKNDSRVVALQENSRAWAPWIFNLESFTRKDIEFGDRHWHTYPERTLHRVARNFGVSSLTGACVAFGSDLPPASGMSSSSSLMIMTLLSLLPHIPLEEDPRFESLGLSTDPLALAQYLACCENGQSCVLGNEVLEGSTGVGTFGGSQDQTAIFHAKQDMLSIHRFCPTRWVLDVPFPRNLALIAGFSGFRAEKTQQAKNAFNLLSAKAKAVVEAYNELAGTHYLWAADLLELEDVEGLLAGPLPSRYRDMGLLDRYKAFYEECQVLIPHATKALRSQDFEALGQTVNRSHDTSRRYLNNISEEIEILVQVARSSGALGASGFGAGFGGSAYALVPKSRTRPFLRAWRDGYLSRVSPPHTPVFFPCYPVSHADPLFA